jgi:molybdopterin-containing oxidoreductase family iron-sulfur binding subunit
MADSKKTYWKGLEELTNELDFVKNAHTEFGPPPSDDVDSSNTPRRDFLKTLGFSVAAVSLAACEAPVRKAIPLLAKPEEYDPSIPNFYASSFIEGGDYASILVKTREGRPIKIEGNNISSVTKGGSSARVQSAVLSLYDTQRFQGAKKGKAYADWKALDNEVINQLSAISAAGGAIRIVSNTILSPSTKSVIADFIVKYPTAKHVVYDANTAHGILKANAATFGVRALPTLHFDKAKVVVTFGADFLGTWVNPIGYAKAWSKTRKLGKNNKEMSRLYAVESNMSLTGSNADYRTPMRASEEGLYVVALYNEVAKLVGGAELSAGKPSGNTKYIVKAAKDLVGAKGASIVVSGSNDANVQTVVNGINNMLGNYGKTIDLATPTLTRQGDDEAMAAFVNEVKSGSVAAVIFYNANPVYDYPKGAELKAALPKVGLSISTSDRNDETTDLCKYVAPDTHFLEAWGDAEPVKGYYSIIQPSISKIFKSRQVQDSLLTWAGASKDYYTYLQDYWNANMFGMQSAYGTFREFWNYTLHDGIFEPAVAKLRSFENKDYKVNDTTTATATVGVLTNAAKSELRSILVNAAQPAFIGTTVDSAASAVASTYKVGSGTDVIIYETVAIGTGVQANNPWLQEMPDPVSRACWDNYITIPVAFAKANNIKMVEGKTVLLSVSVNGTTVKLPAMVQPGQANNTVGIAYGYGREITGIAGKVGGNAFPLASVANGFVNYNLTGAKVEVLNESYDVAHVQTHHTVMGRDIIQEAKLKEYQANPAAGRSFPTIETAEGPKRTSEISIWDMHTRPNHSWGMMIDLNSCIGCGACVVACNAENNVPVVGKDEVFRRREMHWMRIDRYYSSQGKNEYDYEGHEQPEENPEVVYMPLMCQHCNNAPCETVCPVVATTHSTEGLNQMTYNRCIGTRYCANNCPYKVRRFNWFSYPQNPEFPMNFGTTSDLGRMVLNPDVTVRARGVMEKCSMCVQRIQDGKLNAKKENRRPIDGEINTACAQSCPTDAITFGDMNDPLSNIGTLVREEFDKRAYHVLEEINVRPSVGYLTKIRNQDEEPTHTV